MFEEPLDFQPKLGCMKFMQVDPSFWEGLLKPQTSTEDQAESLLLITLSQEEAEGILSGNQTYLLRSQRSTHGRVHICVKSLGFTLLGSVQFEATQTFQSLKPFKSWEGLPGCNPSDVDPASALMKRLKEGKVVYAVTLASPQRAATTVEWCSPVAWSKFLGNPSWGISQQKPGCVYIYICGVCTIKRPHTNFGSPSRRNINQLYV